MALSVQKFGGGKMLSKSVFGYFKTKKKQKKGPTAIKLGGGGGGKARQFLAASLYENSFITRLLR